MSPGESGDTMSVSSLIHQPLSLQVENSSKDVHIISINIRCIQAHKAELEVFLMLHQPHVVLIQETWLNESYESISIVRYSIITRRDRKNSENVGGILMLHFLGHQGPGIGTKKCSFSAGNRNWVLSFGYVARMKCPGMLGAPGMCVWSFKSRS